MTCTKCEETEVVYPHIVIIHSVIHELCDACFEELCGKETVDEPRK